MKRQVVMHIFAFLCTNCFALEEPSLYPINVGERTGYIDKWGKLQVVPNFLFGGSMFEGISVVQIDSSVFGILGESGQLFWIKNLRQLRDVRNGRLAFQDVNGLYGFLDTSGVIVIPPMYKSVTDFGQRATWAELPGAGAKVFDLISMTGRVICEMSLDDVSPFVDGLSIVLKSGKWGAVDEDGKIVLKFQDEGLGMPGDGLIPFESGKGRARRWGVVDLHGQVRIPPQFEAVSGGFSEGYLGVKIAGKWGVINTSGNLILKPIFDGVASSSCNVVRFKVGSLWGFIGIDGHVVHAPSFDGADAFRGTLARINRFSKSSGSSLDEDGYLRLDGTTIWGSQFLVK